MSDDRLVKRVEKAVQKIVSQNGFEGLVEINHMGLEAVPVLRQISNRTASPEMIAAAIHALVYLAFAYAGDPTVLDALRDIRQNGTPLAKRRVALYDQMYADVFQQALSGRAQ